MERSSKVCGVDVSLYILDGFETKVYVLLVSDLFFNKITFFKSIVSVVFLEFKF
jgi:hypothetical protein